MTPSQLWNRCKAFVESVMPEEGRSIKDDVCAKIYQEMKFLCDGSENKPEGKS